MNRDKIKKIAYSFGKLLGFLGLIYIFYKLSKEYSLSSFIEKFSNFKSIILPLLILNILSSIIGIYAWHIMLKTYAKKSFGYISSYYYFAKTEISKYLPGNIFHFVGRQALSSKLGISQAQMAKISLLFMLILMVATVISSTIFALFSNIENYIKILMLFASVASIIAILYIYPIFTKAKKALMVSILTFSIGLQGVLLSIIILWQIKEPTLTLFFEVSSIYIISWLIGFVTPGASGGLGVREGAFIAIAEFINLNVDSNIVIFSVLLVRLINIVVDIIMYISTFLITKKVIV